MKDVITLYTSSCRGDERNAFYPTKTIVECTDDLTRAAMFDHVAAEYRNKRRSNGNFLRSDCLIMDLDNAHTDDPAEWKTLEDIRQSFPDVSFYAVESRNHMKVKKGKAARPKYHVYFPINTVSDSEQYRALKDRTARIFPFFDAGAKDAARFFFGVDNPQACFCNGNLTLDSYLRLYAPAAEHGKTEDEGSNRWNRGRFQMPDMVPEGERTNTLLRLLGSLQARGVSDEAIRAAVLAENEQRCDPPVAEDELEKTVFPALRRFEKGTYYSSNVWFSTEEMHDLISRLIRICPEDASRYGRHDAGNSKLYADLFRDVVCFVPERKKWYFYDGSRWRPDTGNTEVMKRCRLAANALMSYTVQNVKDEHSRTDFMKHVSRWQQFKYRETILRDAAAIMAVSLSEFDKDPDLLNCLNGTLKLQDMSFHQHTSADRLTKIAGVDFDPGVRCARWEQFIDEVTESDKELARYIQKALGYALTGDTRYECFFILYGATSRNGKGTLCETIMQLVGDYGRTANPETIAKRRYSDSRSPSEDIARLVGARFVNLPEPDKQMSFSASLVKTLTGNDTVNARFLGENSFEYRPQFKMFVNTNHLPYVSDSTLFASNRVRVIPFNRHFSEQERDSNLKRKLSKPDSLTGVLNWCLEGLQLLRREGFATPAAVYEETKAYSEYSDRVGEFVKTSLTVDPQGEVEAKAVYERYVEWCWQNNFKAESSNEFQKSLASKGIDVKRKRADADRGKENASRRNFVIGYRLKNA